MRGVREGVSVSKIQRIELKGLYWDNLFCPFCGQQVIAIEEGEFEFRACPHTLFHCVEEGLGFRSKAFDENMGIVGVDDYEIPGADEGFDAFTDGCTIPNSIKFYFPGRSPIHGCHVRRIRFLSLS